MDSDAWKYRSGSSFANDEDLWMYQFRPIIADKEIRVLKLEPATSFAAPLVGSLFVRTIDDPPTTGFPQPTFHCVSYCWGTHRYMQSMLCDTLHLPITQNVDVMLRHFRKALTPRNLWVDTICINQGDETEKSYQVNTMSTIYERADKVHIWLGPASNEDQIPFVFGILRNLALHRQQDDLSHSTGIDMARLNSFLMRPWFTRRWVLQEVKQARTVTVHCGHHRLSWDWVSDGIKMILEELARGRNSDLNTALSLETAQILGGMESLSFHSHEQMDILELLWKHHLRRCIDHRDRVFALYGLLRPTEPNDAELPGGAHFNAHYHCPVDYSVHFSDTYTQLATSLVTQHRGLTVLEHAIIFGSLMYQNPKWPSWVPAWNVRRMWPFNPSRWHEHEESVVRLGSPKHPASVVLSGDLFPITTVQVADESSDAIEFLKTAERPTQVRRGRMAELLTSAVALAAYFRDRQGAHFESAFYKAATTTIEENESPGGDFSRLLSCLRRELSTDTIEDHVLPYSSENLREEVTSVMDGLRLFCYRRGSTEAPGIAFAGCEPGDYIFRLNGDKRVLPYSLVLRQNSILSSVVLVKTLFAFSAAVSTPNLAKLLRHGRLYEHLWKE